MNEWFRRVAGRTSEVVGSAWAFGVAALVIVGWATTGPLFGFGDTWQLVINTGTTIITFLMVFLIQNTQNRDAKAVHAKLDAVIAQLPGSNRMLGAEDLPDDELESELQKRRAQSQEEV